MNRNINWRSCNNIHKPTAWGPRFLTSTVWMNDLEDDMRTHGVEIIEINSTRSHSSNEDTENTLTHMSGDGTRVTEEFDANPESRSRNRVTENGDLYNEIDSFYLNNCLTPDTAEVNAFNQTCLNILDKLSALELDHTPEDINSNKARDSNIEDQCNGDDQDDFIYGSDVDGDKRTIWIYSFKNRRILSEDTYELMNISSRETISSDSSEIDENVSTSRSTRVSSPIPITHIPRLDLSLGATLPNVTEVTEPETLERHGNNMPSQKPANNWCVNSKGTANVTNVVNWMALSPRDSNNLLHVQSAIEVPKDEHKVKVEFKEELTVPAIFEVQSNRSDRADKTISSQGSSTSSKRKFVDNATYLISPFVRGQKQNLFMENETMTPTTVRSVLAEQSDHLGITVQPLPSPINPIEHFDLSEYKRKGYLDRRVRSAGDAALVKNMPLFNPVKWKPYSNLTGSRRSIQHEIKTNKTLFQKCISCMKCCK